MTPKAKEFAEHNKHHAIYAGKWLSETTDEPGWDRLRYRFVNGSTRTLRKADLESLRDAGIESRWAVQ